MSAVQPTLIVAFSDGLDWFYTLYCKTANNTTSILKFVLELVVNAVNTNRVATILQNKDQFRCIFSCYHGSSLK